MLEHMDLCSVLYCWVAALKTHTLCLFSCYFCMYKHNLLQFTRLMQTNLMSSFWQFCNKTLCNFSEIAVFVIVHCSCSLTSKTANCRWRVICGACRRSGKLWKSVIMSGHWMMLTVACLDQCITKLICTKISCLNIDANNKHIVISLFVTLNYFTKCRIVTYSMWSVHCMF